MVIGKQYLDGSSANTGIFGDEIAHFGYFGIIIAGIILLVFLICVKRSEHVNGKVFTCCLTLYLVFGLTDSGVIQIINFSPLLLVVLILWLFELRASEVEEPFRRYRFKVVIKRDLFANAACLNKRRNEKPHDKYCHVAVNN